MRSLGAVVVAGAALAFASAGTASSGDHAQPRGGGSGGGGSHSAGASHHSGGGGSSSSSSGSSSSSSGSSYRDSGGSAGYRSGPPTGAQARHPRAGTGTGYRYYNGYGYGGYYPGYYPYYGGYPYYSSYYPYYGAYYGLGWGYGWSPYFSASWYGYPYGSYGIGVGYSGGYGGGGDSDHSDHYSDDGEGSVSLKVQPNEAKVYVDGYYAGTVDDFDGMFQRLRISPGRHDIALKLDGFHTQTFKVYVPIDQTLKLQHKMVPGTGDDVSQLVGRPEDIARYEQQQSRQQAMGRYQQQQQPPPPQQPRAARPPQEGNEEDDAFRYDNERASDQRGERGLVRLDVRPADASVYVDGAFRGTGRELRQLRLTPGRHQVEVVRPGYRTIAREVDVEGGADTDVTIDLDRSS